VFSDIFLVVDDVRGYPAKLLQLLLSATSHGSDKTGFRRDRDLLHSNERRTQVRAHLRSCLNMWKARIDFSLINYIEEVVEK